MARVEVNVFLSYTRREEEVAALQPATDAYCEILFNWGRTRGVDIFYDRSSIPQGKIYSDDQLRAILGYNVARSHVLVSFLSPEYIGSSWCRFEYETKALLAPREIHKVYWKPEITRPLFPTLARVVNSRRTRFLLDMVDWERIRLGDQGQWRDSRFNEWIFLEDDDNPYNFSDLTDVYKRGVWAGPGPLARCAQKTAEILCREHPDLLGAKFAEHAWFRSNWPY
jgi:hypothetical protein